MHLRLDGLAWVLGAGYFCGIQLITTFLGGPVWSEGEGLGSRGGRGHRNRQSFSFGNKGLETVLKRSGRIPLVLNWGDLYFA